MMVKESRELEKVLESLLAYPAMRFLLFAEEWGSLEKTLFDYCRKREYEIQLYTLDEETHFPKVDAPLLRRREYNTLQKRYNLHGRLYDHLFVTGKIPDAEAFPKKVHSAIVNAGRAYILLDEEKDYEKWAEWMSDGNYVSIGRIDLSERLFLISGKKMHGWGG